MVNLKRTNVYKNIAKEVIGFTIETTGSSRYIYAHFENHKKTTVGRYKTEAEAKQALEIIKNITNSNNLEFY